MVAGRGVLGSEGCGTGAGGALSQPLPRHLHHLPGSQRLQQLLPPGLWSSAYIGFPFPVQYHKEGKFSIEVVFSVANESFYPQIQASEFGAAIRASDADFVIAGGNLEVDPRSSETSYRDVARSARQPVIHTNTELCI